MSGCCCGCDQSKLPEDGSHLMTPEAEKAISAMFRPMPGRPDMIVWGRPELGYGGVAVGYCPLCKHAYGVD